ncbi:SCF ubiquitin ligase complex subunit cdc4 [Clydaea vesicula]|uniref:SCF ubiquitin ligase complex subunit cdc4 n=1 Tax=Clydaea vesicula TaxID=447962 RepID=A0AAD5UA79_9FUNG|nr:SCF ubiquitin ligase complex subunit cdc4 [Clydaea vesicula]
MLQDKAEVFMFPTSSNNTQKSQIFHLSETQPQLTTATPTSKELTDKSNLATLTIKPRAVTTTVVTTTTTTLTEYPPIVIQPPAQASNLDTHFFPLTNVQTPPTLKKFCFDLNGVPTYFKEENHNIICEEKSLTSNIEHHRKHNNTVSQLQSNLDSSTKRKIRKRSIQRSEMLSSSESLGPSDSRTRQKSSVESPNKFLPVLENNKLVIDTAGSDGEGLGTVLPSPTLSPTYENNPGMLGILSNQSATSPFQAPTTANLVHDFEDIRNNFPNFDVSNSEGSSAEAYLQSLPNIISTFDNLPQQLKSYLLLQLLRRCPLPTLQFVSYGPNSEVSLWKFRLNLEGWYDQAEVDLEKKLYNLSLRKKESQIIIKEGTIDSDEELSLYHKNKVCKGKGISHFQTSGSDMSIDPPIHRNPPNLYKNLYRRHHLIRLNWFQNKCKHMSFPGHGYNVVTCLQFDSDKIVSGSDDHTIHIYDTSTGDLRRVLEGHEGGVWALQYWNDVLVSGSTDRSVRVWDMNTGKCRQKFDGHTSTVRCLMIITPVFNNETKTMEPAVPLIVTGSRDSTLRVWKLPNPTTDKPFNVDIDNPIPDDSDNNPFFLHVLSGHSSSVRAIAGHGKVLVSGSYDHNVRVWNLMNGRCTYTFQGHTEKVYSVGYSHELQRAASGSMDATVRVWCTKTGDALFTLKEGHSSLVGLLEFSSTYLVSAAADATLRVWSPTTGKCLATLTGHPAAITCFHHDPKLNKIVSGSDGGVKVWELSSAGYRSHINPPITEGGPGFAFTQGPNGPEPVHGRFIGDIVKDVQGVWRTRMDEKRLVCAVQREGGRTWFEVLDFSEGVDDNIYSDDISADASVDNDDDSDSFGNSKPTFEDGFNRGPYKRLFEPFFDENQRE